MQQFSVRLPDEVAAAVRRLAESRGRSVNQTFEDLVTAATDPVHAPDEMAALRERLARAGLLFDTSLLTSSGPRPSEEEFARARAAAGRGTPLSDIISEQRS